MKNYHSFNFLKKIYFVRTGGSSEELNAANLIAEEVKSLGGDAHLEGFDVDYSEIKTSKLIFDDKYEVECAGSGYSGSTKDEGVKGEVIYFASNDEEFKMVSFKDKIILLPTKRVPHKVYMKGLKDGALGFIVTTGDVYRNAKDVDLDPYLNREPEYKEGYIPTVMIRMRDAEKIIERGYKTANLTLISNDSKRESHDVVAEIKGSEYPDEIITFSAHYDSVAFSKGVFDNGTGVITLLQLFDYYKKNEPKRTLRFIWCGSEEMGLLGSKAYVNMHEDELDKIKLNINIDMVAATLGYDIACVTGENDIVNYIKFVSRELGFPIHVYQGVYSSDSTPFADKGIPAISFARLAKNGGATIHSHNDVIERLSEPNYIKTYSFIINLASRFINACYFPIEKKMPDNMKDEIDYYLLRKERPEKK